MADSSGINSAKNVADADESEVLRTLRARLQVATAAYSETREYELEDLRFYAGSPDNNWQWPADILATRGAVQGQTINARPCLTINKLPQHVHQVTNDQRQNRPRGKVIPADDRADPEVAEVYDGVVRHIEYASNADVAYDTACENQVACGEGYVRILTEYCDENTFDQDIRIGRVRNPFSVFMDPLIQDPCGMDAQWCIIPCDMPHEEYERQYPDASPISALQSMGAGDRLMPQWLTDETIRVAEYFYIDTKVERLNLYPGGVTSFEGTPEDRQNKMVYGKPLRSRNSERKTVRWIKTNGYEILEQKEWAGKYIPVVRVIGNEFEIDGRLHISGLVRNAKDAQRMYNYWTSQEAEMLALAPKAPFVGYGGQFEGYEHQWKSANVQNWPYLEVNPDVTDAQGSPLPLPQRAMPPLAQTGLIQAKLGASEDIKATTGQYDSSLGMVSNERSGKAILARQKEGDTGTYHYVDNLARAVRAVTKQLVDLIPKIYDTERIARIIGEDGEPAMARINPSQAEPVRKIRDAQGVVIEKIYNPSVGKYDVVVVTGPGYATKRQEALEGMGRMIESNPDLWKVAGDLFVKNMDWPGAQELAKRFQKVIDPTLLDESEESPALQAAKKQMEAMQQQMEAMQQMLMNVQESIEAREVAVKEYEAVTRRIAATSESMTPEQIQDTVAGTVAAAIDTGDLVVGASGPREGAIE